MVGEGGEGERGAAARGRFALAAACLLALAPLLGGCGLEEYTVFEPPTNASSSTTAVFSHNLSNNQADFLGYTVVYRIYETSEKASAAANTIQASWDSVPPEYIIKTRLSKLKPVALLDASNQLLDFPPTVKILDKANAADISMLFTYDGTGKITDENNVVVSSFTVRRNAQDGTRYTFGDFTPADDCEFVDEPNSAFILVYAYAYGFSLDSNGLSEFYSQPVQLMIAELSKHP